MTNANQSGQEIELLTPRTVLVPAELFEPTHAHTYLAANGTPAAANDEVVWSDTNREVVAVMAISNGQWTMDNGQCYTSPLLRPLLAERPTVRLYLKEGLLYAQVYDEKMQCAEVIPAPEDVDILYFIERLGATFELKQYELLLTGDYTKVQRKMLRAYFNKVRCE